MGGIASLYAAYDFNREQQKKNAFEARVKESIEEREEELKQTMKELKTKKAKLEQDILELQGKGAPGYYKKRLKYGVYADGLVIQSML